MEGAGLRRLVWVRLFGAVSGSGAGAEDWEAGAEEIGGAEDAEGALVVVGGGKG